MRLYTLGSLTGLSPSETRRLLRDLLDVGWNYAFATLTGGRVVVTVGMLT